MVHNTYFIINNDTISLGIRSIKLLDADDTDAGVFSGCSRRADVVFVLDASGSVETTFDWAMQLTRKVVEGLNFAGGRARVGVVTYSDGPTNRFLLNKYTDKQGVLNAIAYTMENGRTNTAGGIDMMRFDMFHVGER